MFCTGAAAEMRCPGAVFEGVVTEDDFYRENYQRRRVSVAACPNQIQGGLRMRLSVIQMDMRLSESAYNFAHAEALRAAAEGADTALLPET